MTSYYHAFVWWIYLRRSIVRMLLIAVSIWFVLYSRLINLGWGLPYPMHPDERNMVDAIIRLRCDHLSSFPLDLARSAPTVALQYFQSFPSIPLDMATSVTHALGYELTCLKPSFYAYGQISLYMGWLLSWIMHSVSLLINPADTSTMTMPTFGQIALSLRLISAISSIATVWVVYRISRTLYPHKWTLLEQICVISIATWYPAAIQFAHFGTTESLLALLNVVQVWIMMTIAQRMEMAWRPTVMSGLVIGVAIGVKVSALTMVIVPIFVYVCIGIAHTMRLWQTCQRLLPHTRTLPTYLYSVVFRQVLRLWFGWSIYIVGWLMCIGVGMYFASPYNLIDISGFMGSMQYERSIGVGTYVAFYTRQFILETPFLFHLERVWPYSLGVGMMCMAYAGLCGVWHRGRGFTVIILAIVVGFVSGGMLYAKWTRFLAPIYPLLVLCAICAFLDIAFFLRHLRLQFRHFAYGVLGIFWGCMILPGIAYMGIYSHKDVRFVADAWIQKYIPPTAHILFETGNVVDVPLTGPYTDRTSFNFYDLDQEVRLQTELAADRARADYIIVPSRRVFYNHTCASYPREPNDIRPVHSPQKCAYLRSKYPQLHAYYDDLFSGRMGYRLVATFDSYPRITVAGYTLWEQRDEHAEETFTVFDHPVIRIYERVKSGQKS